MVDDATVANLDGDAVVGEDGIGGVEVGSLVIGVNGLCVGSSREHDATEQGTFECAAGDGDDGVALVGVGWTAGNFQLHDIVELGLCLGRQTQR